jgi:hypothetical protein
VAGNHEVYGHATLKILSVMRYWAQVLGIHFLSNAAVVLEGVQFLGMTLWTDFRVDRAP